MYGVKATHYIGWEAACIAAGKSSKKELTNIKVMSPAELKSHNGAVKYEPKARASRFAIALFANAKGKVDVEKLREFVPDVQYALSYIFGMNRGSQADVVYQYSTYRCGACDLS